jgi:serine/threonine-protein kinase
MVSEGDLVADKYRIEKLLGEGGMGYVYSALHEQLGSRVAIKILSPTLCQNDDAVRRFSREARAAVRIQSEHVARVLDVGQLESGAPYMVMEFLSGNDLSHELKERGSLPTHEAVQYVLQACEAVAEAHALGLIHRDLKPANLFLTRRPDGSPFVKVLDFGIAKAIAPDQGAFEPSPSLTATHSFLGSPAYMSPEQVRTPKSVDTRSDIWSLGTILYELLLGELPFQGSNALDLLAAVASDPMPSMRQKRADVSLDLEAVVKKCLAKQPGERYQNVAEFAQALVPHAPQSSLPSVTRISGIQRAPLPATIVTGPSGNGGTLRSTPAGGTADSLNASRPGVTPPTTEKRTITDFGHSQMSRPRSRSRIFVAVGFGVLCFAVAFFLLRSRGGSSGEEPRQQASASAAGLPEPPAPVKTSVPSVAPVASPLVSEPAPSVESAASAKLPFQVPFKPSKKTGAAGASARPSSAAVPAPGPSPKSESNPDPLDGRR